MPPISPKITPVKEKKKWKERGERKEENRKSSGYTLCFYVEFFEEENKHCLINQSINQSIIIPPNIKRHILSYISSCKSKHT